MRYLPWMRLPCWVLTALLAPVIALADPAAESQRAALRAYQAKDYAGFLEHMRDVAAREPDLPRQIYNLAAAEALGGSPDEAIKLLHRLTGTGASFAIDKDDDFRGLRSRADFQAEVRAMKANLAPRGRAEAGFTMRERELLTEGVAYDAKTRTFFVSSVRHRKIVAVDERGRQRDFITEAQDGIGGVFGIAVDAAHRTLWASSTALPHMLGYRPEDKDRSGLYKYDLASGKLIASYAIAHDGRAHALGDVIVSSRGDAYTTDSASPTIYRVAAGAAALEVLVEGGFDSLQGLALSPDEHTLYVADYGRGISAVTLADKKVARLAVAPVIAATGIDGLYLHRGRLIATQNGLDPHRVLAFDLDRSGDGPATKLVAQRVILSGDPRIADLSLGVVVGDALYLNAAAGWLHYNDDGVPNAAAAAPHAILKLALPR
jgi:sugar lactone lactonase YvrE